ncbi:MAG: PIN domain-containing protein [Deltaproteobacteria bacterium]|nr:PIN domain-containing protein [Deltaproteobacteria bacterium]
MYLVDTNVWLERLLDQARAEEVGQFFDRISSDQVFITDFSFHSIGIILSKLNQKEALLRFVQDVFLDGATGLLHLEPGDTQRLVRTMEDYNLDFDDAYQCVAAEIHNLTIVSFDSDFDRTPQTRKIPSEIF